jgi:hypothetical protein
MWLLPVPPNRMTLRWPSRNDRRALKGNVGELLGQQQLGTAHLVDDRAGLFFGVFSSAPMARSKTSWRFRQHIAYRVGRLAPCYPPSTQLTQSRSAKMTGVVRPIQFGDRYENAMIELPQAQQSL